MANLLTTGPKPLQSAASNVSTMSSTLSKRSMADLLPGVNRTETLEKFFNATVDHLFQPENVEFLSGYIGSKPPYYNSEKDFYIPEITQTRTDYQLPVTAITVDQNSNVINNVMFYDDILNQLDLQGANIDNPSRLLNGEYYSWSPPIDLDKFINYYQYYWLPDGPDAILLLDPTDLLNDAKGKTSYTYSGRYKRFSENFDRNGDLVFSSGMRIVATDDINFQINDTNLIIEGVGRSIKIEADMLFENPAWDTIGWNLRGWDGDISVFIPDYMTLGRLSSNLNRWSTNNRWFHKSVIEQSGMIIDPNKAVKAQRPIIEFESDLNLYNFGTYGIYEIDLVDTETTNVFSFVAGQSSALVDGTNIIDGMRILFTADLDNNINNRIYEVGGIAEYGVITLTLIKEGQNPDGSPTHGDCTYVRFGETNSKKTFWYNVSKWVVGQSAVKYQPPLFAGYDADQNNLTDPAIYPGSNFNGTTIFTYELDSNASVDPILNLQIKRDQFGDYVFDNSLVTKTYTFIDNNQTANIVGYIWYKNKDFSNGWYKNNDISRQYIINSFEISTPITTFLIDQIPAENTIGTLPSLMVYKIENGYSTLLYNLIDYNVSGRIITLTTPTPAGSRIEIRSWSNKVAPGKNGYYALPSNLVSNPNNDQITSVSFNQTMQHFSEIISNQFNEESNGVGLTGWRDSEQLRGLGTSILQHKNPLLKLMILNSNNLNTGMLSTTSLTDPSLAIQFAQREYTRFYNRFIRALFNLYSTKGYDKNIAPNLWVDAALNQINVGKSKVNPWAYSGYEQNEDFSNTVDKPTFIPPTATRLGVSAVYTPEAYLDSDYYPPKLTLQTHDGSKIIMEDLQGTPLGTIDQNLTRTRNPNLLTNPVAAAWLQLELNLYNSIPQAYKDSDAVPAFDLRQFIPGKWRTTEYSREEYLQILQPSFDKWLINTQIDYEANTTFSENNQFSFNYKNCVDKQGEPVPGHWRGIYRYFYDTDRPHTHPWEMLGFSQQPAWWENEYGAAPYTRGNEHLWDDLRDGIIRQGTRAGTYSVWARPGLMECIPVDDQGELLPPILAGTVIALPTLLDSQSGWKFGDCGPIENVWLNSLEHGYIIALVSYLMKPAMFIEQGWDPLRTIVAGQSDSRQLLYANTNRRRSSSEFYVHRENPSSLGGTLSIPNETNLSFFGSWGIQHWISEYLISQNLSVTTYLGNIIRGTYGVLAHKFGGFVNTSDSLRVMADSFGQIGYTSQLIPSENIQTYIYRSTSIGVYFYSGVVIVKQKNGWKIFGYDGINQYFTIIPSVQTGPKTNLVIGNQSVIDYRTGQGLQTINYNTVLGSRQEVYDFLISYGRWLESQGWVFDTVNPDNGNIVNWKQSARDFMYWSQGNWADGNFVALSPASSGAKFSKEFGSIQYVNGTIGGTYPVLDKTGQPIESQNVEVLRKDGEIIVRPINGQTVFGLRIFMTSVEHVMLLDNLTQFNDLIYDPLFTVYQPRLKVFGYRTNAWTGRLDAPGYFLYQDPTTNQWSMIDNFEKTTEDFRKIYNIDQPKNSMIIDSTTGVLVEQSSVNHAVTRNDLSDLAKHLISYQPRQYLENLLLDESTEFEFYQGFIRQKGTKRALDSMLRNQQVLAKGQTINYYEEFAFRKGRFGAVSLNNNIDFILYEDEIVNNPQQISVFSQFDSDQSKDGIIQITASDPRIVVPPENYSGKMFPVRSLLNNNFYVDLPTAGYVQLGETTHYVVNLEELINLSSNLITNGKTLNTDDTVWKFITPDLTWDVWKVVDATSKVVNTTPDTVVNTTTINFESAHGIVNGDYIVTSGFTNNSGLNGTFTAQNVTVNSVTIPVGTFIEDANGIVQVYRSVRYYSKTDLIASTILGGWKEGTLVYVDNGDQSGQWTVYKRNQNTWLSYRSAKPKIEASLMLQSQLYNKNSLAVKTNIEYFDPAKGFIPGIADKEITYKSMYDPAQYNAGDATVYNINPDFAWTDSHVGEIWWDLSTTRYIDYEQGDDEYRAKNWAKIAPGTSIDIYEWVRSPISPSEWESYNTTGINIAQYGLSYSVSGTVRNSTNPVWVETTEYDSSGNRKTWYYFWVKNSDMKPAVSTRSLSTNEITNIILNPISNNLPWYAAISERTLIVANINNYLRSDDMVMQIVYTSKPNNANDYKEWSLIRSGDQYSQIDEQFWLKLRDSLTGFDSMNNPVPDINLNELVRYGNLIRPRQSWFKDRLAALAIWVKNVNTQLTTATTPLVLDTEKSTWLNWFGRGEPTPPKEGNWDYQADDMANLSLIAIQATNGTRVLVLPTASNNNLWTIWTWDAAIQEFILTRQQSYNVENYWKYIDWYYTGYSSDNIPTFTVNTTTEADTITITNSQTIKILDYGSLGWALVALVNGERRLVGLQNGTIQITDNLYKSSVNQDGWDQTLYDKEPFDYNPSIETGIIFDGVKEGFYGTGSSIELNKLFFSMINYVLSEQKFVDWIFKTSFVVVSGSNEPLDSSQLYKPNTVDVLLDYLNEVKPYRTKIRDFISGRSVVSNASVALYDFDKPPYQGRILDPSNINDANILINNRTFAPWYENYQSNPGLIRKLKTRLVFDRIASMPETAHIINAYSSGTTVTFTVEPEHIANSFVIGEHVYVSNVIQQGNTVVGFNSNDVTVTYAAGNVIVGTYSGNIGIGSGIYGAVLHQTYGAADRIIREYKPSTFMPNAFTPDLISGSDFKGQIFNGDNFNLGPGWSVASWDFPAGWDAPDSAFDEYLEVMLEGGMPPVYDQFYGTGSRTQFKLSKIPQDLEHTKIWRDGTIAEYGTDYYVPNWAIKAEVALPGTGYSVGDLLELIPNEVTPNSKNITVRVTEIKTNGAISKVEIVNKGFFNIIQHSAYRSEYAPYASGTGVDAYFQPVWGGDNLIFASPPLSSDRPNIWVLYAGTTFEPAPDGNLAITTDGGAFVDPYHQDDHPEELYKTRLKDAVVVDTYSQPVGGRPVVASRSYLTDGLTDHYDLGVRPQSSSAVLAYLDGDMLRYGFDQDYDINYETGELVFVRPPAAGQILNTTTIGEGGAGNSIRRVFVKNPGTGYSIGDTIKLNGGETALKPDGSRDQAVVQVTALQATELNLIDNGSGYKVGDILILSNFGVPESNIISRLILRINTVSKTGAIQDVSIASPGRYLEIPTLVQWETNSKGVGATIDPSWGIASAEVINQGLYSRKPTEPFGQFDIISSTGGNGATFEAQYTSILSQETFIADGIQTTFTLNVAPTSANNVMAVVNGMIIPSSSISLNNDQITIPVPDYGAFVVFTIFNTDQYSTVVTTEITVTTDDLGNLITTYNLDQGSGNTMPDYSTVVVTVNGNILSPPSIDSAVGNGFTRQFDIAFQPSDPSYLFVYVDGIEQVIGDDYNILPGEIVLNYSPVEGASVVVVIVDPVYGYYYSLTKSSITFLSGISDQDYVTVTNFSQDLSYKFIIEQFVGSETGEYELSGEPTSESTLLVTVNGVVQRMLWDYALVKKSSVGYDLQSYELAPYDDELPNRSFVVFNRNVNHTPSDVILIRYMRGRPECLGTAIRQFISSSNFRSSQVLSDQSRTVLLNNVFVNTSEIEVADLTAISNPGLLVPGSIWINNEKIDFTEMRAAPTPELPNRGILSNILRSSGGTSNSPKTVFNTLFYDGNGSNIYFANSSGSTLNNETVIVDNIVQAGGYLEWKVLTTTSDTFLTANTLLSIDSVRLYKNDSQLVYNFDWYIVSSNQIKLTKSYPAGTIFKVEIDAYKDILSNFYFASDPYVSYDPPSKLVGRYIVFDRASVPQVGYHNVKITSQIGNNYNVPCHLAGSMIQDAGSNVIIPGGYTWEPAPYGLQYSKSQMSKFILRHPLTIR